MKKHLLLFYLMLVCLSVNASEKIDGIYYGFSGSEAQVVSGDDKYTGDIVIPETVIYNATTYSVTSIGRYAFKGCKGLTSVTIGDSVGEIGSSAFYGCTGLTAVTIPNSVTLIDYATFQGCSGLESIAVESGNTVYDSRDNCNAIIETATNTLISGSNNSTIPESVTSIGDYAFLGCRGLTSITIPNSVTSIGYRAFYQCI